MTSTQQKCLKLSLIPAKSNFTRLPDKKIGRTAKKHGGSVRLISNNLFSIRDYAILYPVLVYIIKQLFHSLSSYYGYQLIYDSSS